MRFIIVVSVLLFTVPVQAYDPPEGVGAFTLSDGSVLEWYPYEGNWIMYTAGSTDCPILEHNLDRDYWRYTDGEGVVRLYFPFEGGVCPIRSTAWVTAGYEITDVKDLDGNEWIDPRTGHVWGYEVDESSSIEIPTILEYQGLIELFQSKLILIIPLAIALVLAWAVVYAGMSWLIEAFNPEVQERHRDVVYGDGSVIQEYQVREVNHQLSGKSKKGRWRKDGVKVKRGVTPETWGEYRPQVKRVRNWK